MGRRRTAELSRAPLVRDARGANLVEYILLTGFVALVAIYGARRFASSVNAKAEAHAACVAILNCAAGDPSEHSVAGSTGGPSPAVTQAKPSVWRTWLSGGPFVAEPPPLVTANEIVRGPDGKRNYWFDDDPGERRNRTWNDGVTTVRLANATDTQAKIVEVAVMQSREILDKTLRRLENPTEPAVRDALTENFHTTDPSAIAKIRTRLRSMRAAFDGTVPIKVERAADPHIRGYVNRWFPSYSDVHLTPSWFDSVPAWDDSFDRRGPMLIHEVSHKYAGTDDHAYADDVRHERLSPRLAIDNADSYAQLCAALGRPDRRPDTHRP